MGQNLHANMEGFASQSHLLIMLSCFVLCIATNDINQLQRDFDALLYSGHSYLLDTRSISKNTQLSASMLNKGIIIDINIMNNAPSLYIC